MKITALETFCVKPRWMFLKVSTDAGLAGWENSRSKATAAPSPSPWRI